MLGVALALSLQLPVFAGALAVALTMALVVAGLSGRGQASDTLLGVLAHSALAVGLVTASYLNGMRIDLMAYLFGDILAVTQGDLLVIWGGVAMVIALVGWRWGPLLTATLNPDLARASGIDPHRERLILTVALAVVVAVAIKVVGVLLIAALLIIPAAAARPFARTPEIMAVLAGLIGIGAAIGGMWAAYLADTPAGPTIVSCAAAAFATSSITYLTRRAWRR
jgi:zinc transport system permease protein